MKKMKISVTDAARHFADCVNRVHYQRVTFILLRNGEAVDRLVPEDEKVSTAKDWAKLLRENPLSQEEARMWQRDLEHARKMLKPLANKWP